MSAKNLSIKFTLVFFVLCSFSANCANAQSISNQERPKTESVSNYDLSTDQGVLAELQKRADAEREKLGLVNKGTNKLDANNVCIERYKESPKIIVIGYFRYDYGCHFGGAFVDSRYFEKTDIDLHKTALAALGWEKAPPREREMLAKFWVEKGLLAFFKVLQTKPKELENQDFHPPKVVSNENGEIKVTLWIQLPSGMRREKGFQHLEYKFAKDGSYTGSSTLANSATL